ncbi:MAG: DNA topoisomerase I [Nitrososphaeria archaeon]
MSKISDVCGYTLVICEKADAAKRIAYALSDGFKTYNVAGTQVYYVEEGEKNYVICSALGHLYSLGTPREKRDIFPVFDLMWFPLNEVDKERRGVRERIQAISSLSKRAREFVNACDYDVEGSIIGHNIIKYSCNVDASKVLRAKFSTLTKEELTDAFRNLKVGIDTGLIKAGITRHIIDYTWGINLSRVLISALQHTGGTGRVISTGRVQGPTLKFIVDREKEIRSFVTKPYWTAGALVDSDKGTFYAEYFIDKIVRQTEAYSIKKENEGHVGTVDQLRKTRIQLSPPPPFNTGDLQKEAFRLFGFSPSLTLNISERLYLQALISYPRTNSQKLPKSIDYFKIFRGLERLPEYKREVALLLNTKLIPKEGEKDDPAHPSIYPTGEIPSARLDDRQKKVFDLIVRRFFSVFAENAIKERTQLSICVENKHYWKTNGRRTIHPGWIIFYGKYVEIEEQDLPPLQEKESVLIKSVEVYQKYEKRPPRYNRGSLLEKMEEENLGTKATRAEIIETLYKRGYIMGDSMIPTDLGFQITSTLSKHSQRIVSVDLTRDMEKRLEMIELGHETSENVLEDTFYITLQSIEELSNNLERIGLELRDALRQTFYKKNILGKCPSCKEGDLIIIRNKQTGKRFVGCTNYRKGCRASSPLPQHGTIQNIGRTCKICGWPIILVRRGRIPWRLCVNMNCPSKK